MESWLNTCKHCGKEYDAYQKWSEYCSDSCRVMAYRLRKNNGNLHKNPDSLRKANNDLREKNNDMETQTQTKNSDTMLLFRRKTMELYELKQNKPDSAEIPILESELTELFNELQESEIKETMSQRRKDDKVKAQIKIEELTDQLGIAQMKIIELTEKIKDIKSHITVKAKNPDNQDNKNPGNQGNVKEPDSRPVEPVKPVEPEKTEQEKENELKQAKINRNIEYFKAKVKANQRVTYEELRAIGIEPTGRNMEYEGISLIKLWMMKGYEIEPDSKPLISKSDNSEIAKTEQAEQTEEEEKKPFLVGLFNDL